MVKAFILYFLNIKSTHGYEIQKYIQLNQMDYWTRIHSGSVYYALSQLEKSGSIEMNREENIGGKYRKIYSITDKGKNELSELMIKELSRPIYNVSSDKFVVYPFINVVDKDIVIKTFKSHIEELKEGKSALTKWRDIRGEQSSLNVQKLSFDMMISSLDYQIKWHETIISEIDECIKQCSDMLEIIKNVDFSEPSYVKPPNYEDVNVKKIKEDIINNPDRAEEILQELIKKVKK